jgi:GT2 family glycosyltransferase
MTLAASQQGQAIIAPCLTDATNPGLKGYGANLTDRLFHYRWLAKKGNEPYEIPIAGGACMAMGRRFFFEQLGCFDQMRMFGVEDVELSIRCWLFGFSVLVVPGVEVAHLFRPTRNYPWAAYLHNALRTAVLHFSGERLERILNDLEGRNDFSEAARDLFLGDIWERRCFVESRRARDEEWFCRRFEVSL